VIVEIFKYLGKSPDLRRGIGRETLRIVVDGFVKKK
jgi:hypothetical protein